MGLFNKLKDILFEDEEVEEKEVKKEEKREKKEAVMEQVKPIAEKIEPQRRVENPASVAPTREQSRVQTSSTNSQQPKTNCYNYNNTINERELFKSDNTFPFPDFDEEEFSSSYSRQQPQQRSKTTTNVLEYEKKKKIEKKYDYGRYERTETREVVEKKKFKPSPIISPVYGILNEDYKIEDIKDKTEEYASNNLDFNSVRKKAFGDIEALEEAEPKQTYYEETVTVKLKENEEEKKQKVKTIDELLEDTADVEINLEKHNNRVKPEPPKVTEDYEKVDEDLEEIIEPKKSESTNVELEEDDDTLENDLFDLIDSMYDNREDGDY